MNTFLQIMGGIFLFLILIAVLAGLYFWSKWNKLKRFVSSEPAHTPSRIHLVPDDATDWIQEASADKAISEFHSLGFTDVGMFRIKEMEAVRLFGFIHEQEQMMAAVYKHESVGVWSDICIEYENGDEFTVSNAPMGDEIDTRPDVIKIIDKTLDEKQLFEKAKQERKPGPYRLISVEDFSKSFEKSYAKDMEWRNRRGGPTKEEIRRVAKNMDLDFDEADIDQAYTGTQWEMLERLNEECIQQFIKTTTMSVAEWEDIRDNVFSIHEKIPTEMLLEYIEGYIDISEADTDDMESSADMQINERFQMINEKLPDELKAKKIGDVSEPVNAEIYTVPDIDD